MAKILIFENETYFIKLIQENLRIGNHEVTGIIRNKADLCCLLNDRCNRPPADILTIDGDLDDINTEVHIPKLRKIYRNAFFIGFSRVPLEGVDHNITKMEYPYLNYIIQRICGKG